MSIGIAVAIGGAVLMVAEGRRSDAFTVLSDQAEKIVDLRDIVLGGETCGSQEYFGREFSRAYRASATDSTALISMIKRAAKKTVHHAASHDRTIGGRVQYRLLQVGYPTQRGCL